MDTFSQTDRLRAIYAPLCCCFPRRLALSPSSESLNPDSPQLRDWYEQSRPATEVDSTSGRFRSWDHHDTRQSRQEADLLSLHEGVGTLSLTATRRRRPRGRGGDITGGGADEGSGLTRWTLFRSWWRGGGGGIRLVESETEDDHADRPLSDSTSARDALQRVHEDEDAIPLAFEHVTMPPAPPSSAALPPLPPLDPGGALCSPTVSDNTSFSGPEEDRRARRARRHARRRARELGMSVEEFEAGAVADPAEFLQPPFLHVHVPTWRGSKTDRSVTSSTSSASRSRRRDAEEGMLSAFDEGRGGIGGRADGESPAANAVYYHGKEMPYSPHRSVNGETCGKSSRRHNKRVMDGGEYSQADSQAPFVPLPSSPRFDPIPAPSSHGSSSRRSRHRSQPSTTTVSTEASSRASRRSKHREPVHADEATAPHHAALEDTAIGEDGVHYFQDADALPREDFLRQEYQLSYADGATYIDCTEALSPPASTWDHIGVLPRVGTTRASVAVDREGPEGLE